MISDLEIKLGDFKLSDHFDLLEEPDRGLFPEVQHNLVTMARANGIRATSRRLGHRIITLQLYALSGNFRQTKDTLAPILMAGGRQPLWFSDEPDRYWMVELTGESSLVRSLNQRSVAEGQLQFLCEDGLAHSLEPETFPFEITDDGTSATIINSGTYKTPVDVSVTFSTDANSIGFVTDEKIMQLGTAISEDDGDVVLSSKVMNDDMGSGTKNLWSVNTGKYRHNRDNGDHTSQIMGAFTWDSTSVHPSSFGSIDASKPGYWHGPTYSRILTTPLTDFELYHRLEFKANGNRKQRPTCQGILEVNYCDTDGNFVIGFEMKDSADSSERVTYSFFIGEYRMYQGNLPKSVMEKNGGFFGALYMKKIGNEFTFRIARINTDTWKESWTSPTKNWKNNAVAMLPVSQINIWMAKWKNDRAMTIGLTHTRITQFNTQDESLVPKTFYTNDQIFVDGQTNKVFINGIRDDSYRVIGSSQVFEVDTGETEIVAISDGSFSGEVSVRRRYV